MACNFLKMRISCGLRLLPGLLYKQKLGLPPTVVVRGMGNLSFSKTVTPQSPLPVGNLTKDKWNEEDGIEVSRAFQRLKYKRLVKAAVRVGVPYPEQNLQLASLIEDIKRHDVDIPFEKVIEITLHSKSRTGIHEVAGPRGVLFVLQYESFDISYTGHLVKEICNKYDFSFLGLQNQSLVFYNQKGILMATAKDGMSSEEAVEVATKAGAELVSSKLDADGKISLEIFCNPSCLHEMKRQLKDFIVAEAFVGYRPKYLIEVPDSIKTKLAGAIKDFSKIAEIENIYENIK